MESDRIDPLFAILKEVSVHFVFGYQPDEFAGTLRALAEGELTVEPMVTGTVGIEGVASAFDELGSPEAHAKILVTHDTP
jgi:threonine dehydrogenase-like Zn-dependent dehydrogenase